MDALPPDHIRLLHVEAGSDEQPLRCRLVTTSLLSQPSYEALSYTWGTVEKNSTITCDASPLPVTQNLYHALRYLRQPNDERIVWVDAVCIRQNNDQERTQQVGIMRQIYSNATHVFIWLGEQTSEDEAAFSMLNRFQELFSKYGYLEIDWAYSRQYGLGLPDPEAEEWAALVKLFQRPWFTRVWVIQEVVTAKKASVICGSLSLDWDLVSQVSLSVTKSGLIGSHEIRVYAPGVSCAVVIWALKLSREKNISTWPLIELLRLTRIYKATDPRDKVFALVGLVPDTNTIGVDVDYQMQTEEVYLRVAVHSLEVNKSLVCLSNAGICTTPGSYTHMLPTWVPDWSHDYDRKSIIGFGNHFHATRDSQPVISISTDRKVLKVRGVTIDTISQFNIRVINSQDSYGNDDKEQERHRLDLKRVIESCDALAKAAYKFPEGQSREEAFWRTWCCDLTTQIPCVRAPDDYGIGYKLLRMLDSATGEDGKIDPEKLDGEFLGKNLVHTTAFSHAAIKYGRGRSTCVTTGGYIGRVPRQSAVGDMVCLLFGGSVPFIIRECADGYFKLIGECYIHGIMDGEAMKREDIESSSRDFEIR